MAVSCPEVMYGAYYPYLYGRAGPSRPFYQYERVSLLYFESVMKTRGIFWTASLVLLFLINFKQNVKSL
jgi:hypothetical protein